MQNTTNFGLKKPELPEYFNLADLNYNWDTLDSTIYDIESDIKSYIGMVDDNIYGVEVDFYNKVFNRLGGAKYKSQGADFDTINAFGGRKRCNLTDNGIVLAYYGETGYTETGATTVAITKNSIVYPIGTKVQVMVEQPKFYYRMMPQQLEKIMTYETDTLTVTAGATSSGNVTVTLNGVAFNVAVLSTDNTTTLVATKIRAATYTGWVTSGTGATVIFTATTNDVKTAPTFSGGTTGATANFKRTIQGGNDKGWHVKKASYYVSDTATQGLTLHPAFNVGGAIKDYIYLSAFEASIYDVSASAYLLANEQVADFTATTGDKLCSIANAKPCSGLTQNLTRANSRQLAKNRGVGWQLHNIYGLSVTQLLFSIEYASMDMQAKIGIGVSNKVDDRLTNMAESTGGTTTLGNASGSLKNVNNYNVTTYRGEENLYGNIWTWLDGINVEAKGIHGVYVDNNISTIADDTKTNYTDTEFTLSKVNGYISRFGYAENSDFLFLPTENLGANSLPVGDYFYQNHIYNGFMDALLGGRWDTGSGCGAFFLPVANTSSSRARDIGGRLMYVPQ